MTGAAPSVFLDPSAFAYVVGVDIGSETCCFTVLTPQKQVVIKPSDLANAASGFEHLQERLTGLGEHPARIVVGMEATSRNAGKSLSLPPCLEAITCVCCTPDKPMSRLRDGGDGPRPIVWMPAPLLGCYSAGKRGWAMCPMSRLPAIANWCACILSSVMNWRGTKMRSRDCWWSCFRSSSRYLPIPADSLQRQYSRRIRVPGPFVQQGWMPLQPSCALLLPATTGGAPPGG